MIIQHWPCYVILITFVLICCNLLSAQGNLVRLPVHFSDADSAINIIDPDSTERVLIRVKKNPEETEETVDSASKPDNDEEKDDANNDEVLEKQAESNQTTVKPNLSDKFKEEIKELYELIASNHTKEALKKFAKKLDNSTLEQLDQIENELNANSTDVWNSKNENKLLLSNGSKTNDKKVSSRKEGSSKDKSNLNSFYLSLMAWACVAGFGLLVGLLVGLLIFGSD